MELPQLVTHFMQKNEQKKDFFLSLLLDVHGCVASVWHIDEKRMPVVVSVKSQEFPEDSWEVRLAQAEQAISSLDVESDVAVDKVILGLPAIYLTDDGNIKKEIRPYLRKITHALELSPMGFVSIHQALIHQLKREEGVPPTVILLGVSDGSMTVSVYKIGALVGQKIVSISDPVIDLEHALRGFHDLEVLPSRMLIYGTSEDVLEELKRNLLRHPWQTKANFMHFPKIDVLQEEKLIGAVSLVGASELATAMGTDEPDEEVVVQDQKAKEEEKETAAVSEEEPNVVLVDPGSLGFKRSVDVLSERSFNRQKQPVMEQEAEEELPTPGKKIFLPALPNIRIPDISFKKFRLPSGSRLPVAGGVCIFFLILLWVFYWFVPRASVTVYEVPKKLTKSVPLSIDPTATIADSASKTLPGKKQEKTMNGDKAMAATGKKQIGDPAKGAVTIYNKIIASSSSANLTLAKGTMFTNGDMQFTLDAAVTLPPASAVEFTKVNGGITASFIGTKGNLPAKTVFTVKGYDLSEIAAQNEQALSGGTSRDVTVVSRTDQDNLVKALTQELVDKAQQDLTGMVGGDEQLIEGTIKTTVVDKAFVEEIDQEAATLHGKITIAVSGISYSKNDLVTLLTTLTTGDVPSGYVLDAKNVKVDLSDVQAKKDGKITATAAIDGVSTPQLDTTAITKAISGKSIQSAQDYLKSISGVGAASFSVFSPLKNRLPVNVKNIVIRIAIQE